VTCERRPPEARRFVRGRLQDADSGTASPAEPGRLRSQQLEHRCVGRRESMGKPSEHLGFRPMVRTAACTCREFVGNQRFLVSCTYADGGRRQVNSEVHGRNKSMRTQLFTPGRACSAGALNRTLAAIPVRLSRNERQPNRQAPLASRSSPHPGDRLQPARTSMRRGFASSRRGIVSFSTPSFSAASMRDVSKSSLTVNRREK